MAELVTRGTSNLRIAVCLGSTSSGASCCFREQVTLHSLLSTSWFYEWIRECFK
jgi:hypothetical protein